MFAQGFVERLLTGIEVTSDPVLDEARSRWKFSVRDS